MELLDLRSGDVVVDVGCGTGLSFREVQEKIGPGGRLFGIELSPDMASRARSRASAHGWDNVTVVEAPAEEALLPESPDALLSVLTHDVMSSSGAVANVVGQLRRDARLAVCGAKWSARWALPVNALVWLVARRYVTTFEGFGRPWTRLEEHVPDLHVRSAYLGGIYFAWGRSSRSTEMKENHDRGRSRS